MNYKSMRDELIKKRNEEFDVLQKQLIDITGRYNKESSELNQKIIGVINQFNEEEHELSIQLKLLDEKDKIIKE